MKKRIITFLLIAIVLIAAVGISHIAAHRGIYTVYEEDDQWYIKTNVGLPVNAETTKSLRSHHYDWPELDSHDYYWTRFSSLDELRKEVLSNNGLTISSLQWYQHKNGLSKPILICDLDNLYEPVFPNGGSVSDFTFCGDSYYRSFSASYPGGGCKGQFRIIYNQEEYLYYFNSRFGSDYSAIPEITVNEMTAGKTARDILKEWDSSYQDDTPLRFALHTDTGDIWYVDDPYLPDEHPKFKIINMFCKRGDVGLWVQLDYALAGSAPPVDFLAGFGVTPVE